MRIRGSHVIFIFMAVLLPMVIRPYAFANDEACLECHDEVNETIDTRYYVHEPVRNKQCKICHAQNQPEVVSNPEDHSSSNRYVLDYGSSETTEKSQPINWLRENFSPAYHQFALINEKELKDRLILEIWYEQDGKKTIEYTTPQIATLETQTPQFQMLSIVGLEMTDFDTLLLPRATLRWTTNEPSRCTTRYGNNDLDATYEEDDLYTYDHHVDLRNFTSSGYVVEIKCRDPYRRIQSTQRFNILDLPNHEAQPTSTTATGNKITLKNLQNKLWIGVHSKQKATLSIGSQRTATPSGQPQVATTPQTAPQQTQQEDTKHLSLNTQFYTTTKVCYTCHNGLEPGQSHPVNVLPPLNMTIPPEYKLLQNGRISCMTCHSVHGGNTEYRLIKKSPKALCTGCHTNY
nr:cytochrome c3 family protein [uncultured Desulfuromonas sp.]